MLYALIITIQNKYEMLNVCFWQGFESLKAEALNFTVAREEFCPRLFPWISLDGSSATILG